MSNSTERYQKLGLRESLTRIYQYPIACKELSSILRGAYGKLPKNLQALIFQDTLTAFRLLPEMQTRSANAAAQLLLQSAESALPKQKKSLVVTEFKQAKVAYIRRGRAHREETVSAQLPQDVLVHIFSLLDLQSLISVTLVCRSWSLAANDSHLWELQYTTVFGRSKTCSRTKMQQSSRLVKEDYMFLKENGDTKTHIHWKESFKRVYTGSFAKTLMSNRGYCGHCNTIVWLKNLKCSNRQCELKYESQQIKPVSPHQVAEYLMDGCISVMSSSDSDSESDEGPVSRLWAYPRNRSRYEKKRIR
ncbi:PREDICTED: F-box protein At5g52880 isoform X1 [Theobroma cacao]|uniref:F-box protein At5g52880 isoform X1 n=1 Tax=Theobroma cacao TaxID=3641 RepID=A0AB32VFV1_THECC|nr:PREDICTED: F-box protein At5g52880 isoform X1 [Theobroma cacao]